MKLLVSVIDREEARVAGASSADVIDIKNPREGSLGAQSPETIREIKSVIPAGIPCSVTLGDASNRPGTYALAAVGAVHAGADWVKVGLLDFKTPEESIAFLRTIRKSLNSVNPKTKLLAVFYADWASLSSISWTQAKKICLLAGADGCVLDTFQKNGKDLFFYCAPEETHQFVEECRDAGLISGLAGSLKEDHLETLMAIHPDLIGVRTAICSDRIRENSGISREKIDRFKKTLSSQPVPM